MQVERDFVHFYLAIRSIVFKLIKGNVPDTAQMNTKVRKMIRNALKSDGVEEINKIKGVDFPKKMQSLIERYNERKEDDVLRSEVYEEMANQLLFNLTN